jgi:hypothetical protein
VLSLGYSPRGSAFLGFEWPFERGGPSRLLRFDAGSGEPTVVAVIARKAAHEVFCARGELLVTTEGDVVDTLTGRTRKSFVFRRQQNRE